MHARKIWPLSLLVNWRNLTRKAIQAAWKISLKNTSIAFFSTRLHSMMNSYDELRICVPENCTQEYRTTANSAVCFLWMQEKASLFCNAIKYTTACTSVNNSQKCFQSSILFLMTGKWTACWNSSDCFSSLIWPYFTTVDCLCPDFIRCFFSPLSTVPIKNVFFIWNFIFIILVSLKWINLSWSNVQVNKVMYIYQINFLPAKVL